MTEMGGKLAMSGVHLSIKVKQLLWAQDTDEGLYCVLSTGSTRFTTSKASASQELFLVSPWELSHATKKPLTVSPSTQHDHSSPTSSPVLTVELMASKRWGADAVIATGELLLGPLMSQLQPNGPGLVSTVVLTRVGGKAAPKPVTKSPSSSAAAASSAADAAVAGADTQAVVLQLSTVAAPAVPEQLMGPMGSGHAEVPPRFCADASWLNWQQPLLHTGAGHMYRAPTVQLLRVTLHKAQGLQNLHVDPLAAAAAAAAMGRMASAVGSGPARVDSRVIRAKAVAEKAMLDGSKVGRNILQQTSTWFKRSKAAAAAGGSTAAAAQGTAAAAAAQASPPRPPAGAAPSSTSSSPAPGSSPVAAAWFPSSDGTAASAAAAAVGAAGPDAATAAAAAAAAGSGDLVPRSSSGQLVPGSTAGGGPEQPDTPRSLQHSNSSSSSGSGSSRQPSAPLAPNPHSSSTAQQALQQAVSNIEAAAEEAVQHAEEAAGGVVARELTSLAEDLPMAHHQQQQQQQGHAPGSLADPVSLLKQARQHTRNSSVDAEAVMAALEENGFHATDAYMGAFFYTRVSLTGTGDAGSGASSGSAGSSSGSSSYVSKVVALALSGEAVWDQGFWLPVVRPAPVGAALELELYAAKDDKTRGKLVASVKAPLAQLLPPDQPSSSLPWAQCSHVLQASFSDHLHCSFSLTVQVADWDQRAQLAGIPRALSAATTADQVSLQSAAAVADAAPKVTATEANAAAGANLGAGVDPSREAAAAAGLSREAVLQGTSGRPAGEAAAGAAASSSQQQQHQPHVAVLDLVVKSFDTHKPLDVFFVLLLGPYCLVSSTSHSTQHHHWGWHLKLPVAQPDDVLTLALLAREDQAGGRKRVGAPILTVFSSSIKLVGKLRVRLSTLPANTPLNLSMPLQGERTNLKAGQPNAATAHLYFNLAVPQLLSVYLPAYARFSVCSPGLYLLATSPQVVGPDSTLEALAAEVQGTTARWVEQQPPMLPGRVYRKVIDDGRSEFTLSRTRANWRRLTLLRDATAPARQAFGHLCSWSNPWHSGGWYCVILLFGLYPSRVLSIMLLLLSFALLRKVKQVHPAPAATVAGTVAAAATGGAAAAAMVSTKSLPRSSSSVAGAATTAAAAGAAAVVVAGVGRSSSWGLIPVEPPPPMWDPSYASPEDAAQPSGAVPTDPYTSLKQNYEAVIAFLTLVQCVIDTWASAGERLQLAFSWTDPLATAVLLGVMLALAAGLWLLGLQALITVGLLWVFRHPILRTPLPPPPVNFVWRLPTKADTML